MPLGAFRQSLNLSVPATVAETYWYNIFRSTGGERWTACAFDTDGNIYTLGRTDGFSSLIAKYNSSGTIQWQKQVATNEYYSICTSGSDVILGGYSSIGPALMKLDTNGNITWQKGYNLTGGYFEIGSSIVADSSGNIYGTGNYNVSGASRPFLIKVDSSGTHQWSRQINWQGTTQYGYSINLDSSQSVLVSIHVNQGDRAAVCKFNSSGTFTFARSIAGVTTTSVNGIKSIQTDSSNNIYLIGSLVNTNESAMIYKLNSSGTYQWARVIGTTNVVEFSLGSAIDTNGNLYFPVTWDNLENYIFKYNSDGTLQFQRSINATNNQTFSGIAWRNNAIILAGLTTFSGDNDGMLFKLPDDGTKTGTYGSYTYASSSLTNASYSGSVTTITPTITNLSPTTSNTSATLSNTSITSTTTTIT